jgi:Putative polyhydroxyalkanoic acid system protein (PHA_gran_rgn)
MMEIAIPHNLGREEARRRMRANSASIGDAVPGGMADISASWPGEDRMVLAISAMGQTMEGAVEIEDARLVFTLDLPFMLSFAEPMVAEMVRGQGQHLLAPPKA